MVQASSASTLATPGNGGVYGSTPSSRRQARVVKVSQIFSGTGRHCLWNQHAHNLILTGQRCFPRQRDFRAGAGWLFRGENKGSNARSERSESANEDILIFFFQLDLATRVQYALNLDQYDVAKQLRDKLNEVEEEITRQKEAKTGSSSKSEAQDQAIRILRIRADLQDAVESEKYALAAELRDEISKLEAQSLAASAKSLAYKNVQYGFRLGQKVHHKIFGYRGVICGMDPMCCESRSWMETANIENLSRGSNQPFYQVLVDVHADPDLLVAYVAEENLMVPEKLDRGRFDHPYTSFLFYGMDTAGDFIPVKQLREKYSQPRHEVPFDQEDEEGGKDV